MKKCSKCQKIKNENEFSFKVKSKNILHRQCKECTRQTIKNHYNKNRQYYLEKASKRNDEIRQKIVGHLIKHFSDHPCVDCGETDPTVLEFDHIGEIPKFMAVSSIIRHGYPIEVIIQEVSKCEVRCANCHKRKTARQFGWLKSK